MKRLSLYLFLILFTLQAPSKADDIRDFEIEGISVGDSLLDYFSEEEIKEGKHIDIDQYPGSNKFIMSSFSNHKSFKIYEAVTVNYKTKSKKYIVYSLEGRLFFEKNIESCLKKKDEIVAEASQIFKNAEKYSGQKKHRADKSGKSKYISTVFELESSEVIQVSCTDWSDEMEKEHGVVDELKITISDKEFSDFLANEAYK